MLSRSRSALFWHRWDWLLQLSPTPKLCIILLNCKEKNLCVETLEKDKSGRKENIFKTLPCSFAAFFRSKHRIPMAINPLKGVHTCTNTAFFLMICSHMHFRVESLLISDSPSLRSFSSHLCVLAFVNISPLNLSENFDRGLLYVNWFKKRKM